MDVNNWFVSEQFRKEWLKGDLKMKEIYLMKYKVNYIDEWKFKVFTSFEKATNFHRTYSHHILNKKRARLLIGEIAFITHYEIMVLDLDLTEQTYNSHKNENCDVESKDLKCDTNPNWFQNKEKNES